MSLDRSHLGENIFLKPILGYGLSLDQKPFCETSFITDIHRSSLAAASNKTPPVNETFKFTKRPPLRAGLMGIALASPEDIIDSMDVVIEGASVDDGDDIIIEDVLPKQRSCKSDGDSLDRSSSSEYLNHDLVFSGSSLDRRNITRRRQMYSKYPGKSFDDELEDNCVTSDFINNIDDSYERSAKNKFREYFTDNIDTLSDSNPNPICVAEVHLPHKETIVVSDKPTESDTVVKKVEEKTKFFTKKSRADRKSASSLCDHSQNTTLFEKRFGKLKKINKLEKSKRLSASALYDQSPTEAFYNKTGSVRLSSMELFEKFCSDDFGSLYGHESRNGYYNEPTSSNSEDLYQENTQYTGRRRLQQIVRDVSEYERSKNVDTRRTKSAERIRTLRSEDSGIISEIVMEKFSNEKVGSSKYSLPVSTDSELSHSKQGTPKFKNTAKIMETQFIFEFPDEDSIEKQETDTSDIFLCENSTNMDSVEQKQIQSQFSFDVQEETCSERQPLESCDSENFYTEKSIDVNFSSVDMYEPCLSVYQFTKRNSFKKEIIPNFKDRPFFEWCNLEFRAIDDDSPSVSKMMSVSSSEDQLKNDNIDSRSYSSDVFISQEDTLTNIEEPPLSKSANRAKLIHQKEFEIEDYISSGKSNSTTNENEEECFSFEKCSKYSTETPKSISERIEFFEDMPKLISNKLSSTPSSYISKCVINVNEDKPNNPEDLNKYKLKNIYYTVDKNEYALSLDEDNSTETSELCQNNKVSLLVQEYEDDAGTNSSKEELNDHRTNVIHLDIGQQTVTMSTRLSMQKLKPFCLKRTETLESEEPMSSQSDHNMSTSGKSTKATSDSTGGESSTTNLNEQYIKLSDVDISSEGKKKSNKSVFCRIRKDRQANAIMSVSKKTTRCFPL